MSMFKDINFHQRTLTDIRWNADGQYIGSSSLDKTVRIGQLDNSGNVRALQTVPSSSVMTQVCWNPLDDPVRFAIAGDDKPVELWDVRASRATSKLQSQGNNLSCAWSPNGQYLALLNKADNVSVFDVASSRLIKKVKFGYEINELQWTANSDYLLVATASADLGNIDIINFKNDDLSLVDTISAHTSNCFALKLDDGYRRMAVGGGDYNVTLWDLEDMVCHHSIPLDSSVRVLSFSGDGRHLALTSELQPILYICDSDSGEILSKIDTKYPLLAMAWHPKHNLLAIAPDDRGTIMTPPSLPIPPQYLPYGHHIQQQQQPYYNQTPPPQFMRLLTLPPLKC